MPIDPGARALAEAGLLPTFRNIPLGRARVKPEGNRQTITLAVKDRVSAVIEKEIIKETIRSLLDVITEFGLQSTSLVRSACDNVPWETVRSLLSRILGDTQIRIFACTNEIIILPENDRTRLISENHSSAVGGHKGITKTYNRMKKRYHWTRMKADVQNFIQNCRPCQLKKLVRIKTKQPMVLTDTPDAAFDKISMDIMGPLPITRSENRYILTIQDLLTKYSLAIPLPSAGAIQVAHAFTEELVCVFGAPKAILTDQGTHFLNSLMRSVARKFKIRHFKTTAYRPQSNGSVERSHQVLWEYLKQYVDRNNEWDECLKLASFSYNTSVHEGTRYTPFELVFGKAARVPSSEPDEINERNESYAEYLTTLFNRIKDAQQNAREHLIAAKTRSKLYHDRKLCTRRFKAGDSVYLLKEPTRGKLGDQYLGPYKILEMLRNYNVKLAISTRKSRIVQNKLKHAPTTPQSPPTDEDDDEYNDRPDGGPASSAPTPK